MVDLINQWPSVPTIHPSCWKLHDPGFNRFWDIGDLKAENRQFCLLWPWNPGQGSPKVIDFGTNRKRVYTFLSVINSNFSLSCTVSEIWRLKGRKSPILPTSRSGGIPQNFGMKLALEKLDGATVWWKFHNPNFNRFCMIHPSGRRTDRRPILSALCYMLSRAKKCIVYSAGTLRTLVRLHAWIVDEIRLYITCWWKSLDQHITERTIQIERQILEWELLETVGPIRKHQNDVHCKV